MPQPADGAPGCCCKQRLQTMSLYITRSVMCRPRKATPQQQILALAQRWRPSSIFCRQMVHLCPACRQARLQQQAPRFSCTAALDLIIFMHAATYCGQNSAAYRFCLCSPLENLPAQTPVQLQVSACPMSGSWRCKKAALRYQREQTCPRATSSTAAPLPALSLRSSSASWLSSVSGRLLLWFLHAF